MYNFVREPMKKLRKNKRTKRRNSQRNSEQGSVGQKFEQKMKKYRKQSLGVKFEKTGKLNDGKLKIERLEKMEKWKTKEKLI